MISTIMMLVYKVVIFSGIFFLVEKNTIAEGVFNSDNFFPLFKLNLSNSI